MLPFNKCLWLNESIHTDAYCIDSLNTEVSITCVVLLGVLIFFRLIYNICIDAGIVVISALHALYCWFLLWSHGSCKLIYWSPCLYGISTHTAKFYERGWAHLQIHNVYHACTIWWLTYHLTVEWNWCRHKSQATLPFVQQLVRLN